MALELLAPAKLNLALEVTGRRPDGYHDIVGVMQTIDLADRLRLDLAPSIEIEVTGEKMLGVPLEGPRNLAYRAALALLEQLPLLGHLRREGRKMYGDAHGARIVLEKAIPAGMGLGGGSSDAAAVLRGLNVLWGLGLSTEALASIAGRLGSDVAFLLVGGAALVTGRGERVEPLPDAPPRAFTVFVADIEVEDKTRRMYAALTPADFSDGRRARVLARSLRRGLPFAAADLVNVFGRHIGEAAPPLARAMALCREAGLAVFACGSGPGFFSCTAREDVPGLLLRELDREWGVTAIACRGLARAEATALREV